MAKTPKKLITESALALKQVMQENLAIIAGNMIDQIINKASNLTDSQILNAIKDVSPVGIAEYKDKLLAALAIVGTDALDQVRREVPKKKNVRLSDGEDTKEILMLAEFDHLPPALQKKMRAYQQLLIDTQVADLEKAVYFQFTSSVESTGDLAVVKKDLLDTAEEYVTGTSVSAAAGINAANIVNSSRQLFFDDPAVSDEIESYTFTNGDPVSPICQDLAGTTFAKDDPEAQRYLPPLHPNCKSYIVANLKGTKAADKEIEDLAPSSKSLDKYVTLSEDACCGNHRKL